MAHLHAFDEIPTRRDLEEHLLHGYRRWEGLRGRAGMSVVHHLAAPPARV
jgi:hypothetical protein